MDEITRLDQLLAKCLAGGQALWPDDWDTAHHFRIAAERARYHGISALLLPIATHWPSAVRDLLRARALVIAQWELHHRQLLERLLAELGRGGVDSLFLKGTALAYLTYSEPALRPRADSDVLVRPAQLTEARRALKEAGFVLNVAACAGASTALQENWQRQSGGARHTIDLHWAAFNSLFLSPILPVDECFAHSVELPRLAPFSRTLDPARLLLHVCIHRNMHRTAPYFSNGKATVGADRLIWASDITLLTKCFERADWSEFLELAANKGVSRAMRESLDFAAQMAGAEIPGVVRRELDQNGEEDGRSTYLLEAGRRARVIANLGAAGWRQRLSQLPALLLPPVEALRARYPRWRRLPRPVLVARRFFEFLAGRAP